MRTSHEGLNFAKHAVGMLPGQGCHRLAMAVGFAGNQVEGGPTLIAGDRCVRLRHKAPHALRQPVVTAGVTDAGVHALLHDAPAIAAGDEEEAMMIKLIAVLDGGAVDLGSEFAGVNERLGLVAEAVAGLANVERSLTA